MAHPCTPRGRSRSRTGAISLLLVAGLLGLQSTARAEWPANLAPLHELKSSFEQLAFPGATPFGNPNVTLMKWQGPMTVVIQGPHAATRFGMVQRETAEISRLTGVQIKVHRARNGAVLRFPMRGQVRMQFGPKRQMVSELRRVVGHRHGIRADRLRRTNCIAFFYGPDGRRIARGLIYNATDTVQGAGSRCVYHELMHVLGLSGHTRQIESIMLSGGVMQRPTLNDRVILTALYDPRLRAGMRREQVLPVLDRILTELAERIARMGPDALARPTN